MNASINDLSSHFIILSVLSCSLIPIPIYFMIIKMNSAKVAIYLVISSFCSSAPLLFLSSCMEDAALARQRQVQLYKVT